MKNLLFVVMVTLLLASCAKSPEQKAEALIKEQMQKTLYHPDTYAPSGTQVDSAFTPYDDPVFYEKTLKLAKLLSHILELSHTDPDSSRWTLKQGLTRVSLLDCANTYMPFWGEKLTWKDGVLK